MRVESDHCTVTLLLINCRVQRYWLALDRDINCPNLSYQPDNLFCSRSGQSIDKFGHLFASRSDELNASLCPDDCWCQYITTNPARSSSVWFLHEFLSFWQSIQCPNVYTNPSRPSRAWELSNTGRPCHVWATTWSVRIWLEKPIWLWKLIVCMSVSLFHIEYYRQMFLGRKWSWHSFFNV